MDGLASGITGVGATTFAILAASLGRADPAIVAAALAGACAAFLIYNFHPARVFMGDAGSMLLGFVIAGVAVSGVMKSAAAIAFVAPLIILAIPILDTSFVILKRLKYGLPVYSADRSHFHHRFFTIGWGQRKTVLALYAWCALMGAAAITLRFVRYRDPDGGLNLDGALVLGGAGLLALAASVYMVYVLEILKWRSTPVVTLVRQSRFSRAGRREVARR
jgi:UDP-GlcNAc:undecaprenyl-phosphate/decaprenyl-phosphate GlcNAc-1-phosphate transferase